MGVLESLEPEEYSQIIFKDYFMISLKEQSQEHQKNFTKTDSF